MLKISRFEFADSMSFCAGSLSRLSGKLVSSKGKKKEKLRILSQVEDLCWMGGKSGAFDEAMYKLALGKGIFPYNLVTSIRSMKNRKTFPKYSAFLEVCHMISREKNV